MTRFKVDAELIQETAKMLNGNEDLIRYLIPIFVSNLQEFDEEGTSEFGDSDWCYLFIVFLMGIAVGSTNDRIMDEMRAFNILNSMEGGLKQ